MAFARCLDGDRAPKIAGSPAARKSKSQDKRLARRTRSGSVADERAAIGGDAPRRVSPFGFGRRTKPEPIRFGNPVASAIAFRDTLSIGQPG